MNVAEKNKFTIKPKPSYPKSQTSINLVEQTKPPIELKIKKFDNINRSYFIREVDSLNTTNKKTSDLVDAYNTAAKIKQQNFSILNEATIFYSPSKKEKKNLLKKNPKQIPEFFIQPSKDLSLAPDSTSTNLSKLSFNSIESSEVNKNNEIAHLPKSSKISSNNNTVHVVNTLERTNTNVYFWYYKNNECQRNSCKIKIRFPKLNKERTDMTMQKSKQEKESLNSAVIRCMSPNQKHLTESMKYFLEEKSVIASSFNGSRKTPSLHEYYMSEQEKINNKNFQKSSLSYSSSKKTQPSETLDDLFYDFDSPLPDVGQILKKKTRTNLTMAELKSLSVSDKFLEEARRMVYIPEQNAFHPKYRYYYKKE
jgi:hypothetical protein